MPRLKLTNAAIKEHTTGTRAELWDTASPGLHLVITPAGAQTFYLKYRANGTQRKVKLGAYGTALTIDQARREAAKKRGDVAKGADPQAERKANRDAMRMVDLFGDGEGEDPKERKYTGWYLGTYVWTAGKLGTAKTEKGIANDRSYVKKHLRSRKRLMGKRVDAVTIADLNKIKAETTPSTWRKLRNILLVAFRHAEESGAIAPGSNPVLKTKASTDAKRERFLTPDERKRLDAAMTDLEKLGPEGLRKNDDGTWTGGLSKHLVRALRLLVLTGMRRSEVLKLQWQAIDWRASVLRIVGKTGPRVVPLTPQALAYLKAEKGKGARIGLVCCTGDGGEIHPENVSRAWQSVRKAAKLEKVRLHDLRHSWASDAVSAGVPLYVVGKALGHTQPNTTARYSHLHDEAVREGLAKAGAAIEAATKG